jgi:uncharacterized protein DUF6403
MSWLIWPIGGVLLLAAGVLTVLLPRLRARALVRRTAWSSAHAAIGTATISRDASPVRVGEAEQLLTRAELIAAARGGHAAARAAAECAERADRLWRAAANG